MATPKIGNRVTPAAFFEYFSSQETIGPQLPSRFSVTIMRKNKEDGVFLCDMAQIPSYKIRSYQDFLSGSVSPIPTPYGRVVNSNIFQFIIEETWVSRKYFEDWQNSIFILQNGSKSKVNYIEDIGGQIFIQPINMIGKTNTYYRLDDCIPVEILPAKLDASSMNQPLKFSVNIFASGYYTPTQ